MGSSSNYTTLVVSSLLPQSLLVDQGDWTLSALATTMFRRCSPSGRSQIEVLRIAFSCLFVARFIPLLIRLGLGPVRAQNFLIPTSDVLSVQHDREITSNHAQPILFFFPLLLFLFHGAHWSLCANTSLTKDTALTSIEIPISARCITKSVYDAKPLDR